MCWKRWHATFCVAAGRWRSTFLSLFVLPERGIVAQASYGASFGNSLQSIKGAYLNCLFSENFIGKCHPSAPSHI